MEDEFEARGQVSGHGGDGGDGKVWKKCMESRRNWVNFNFIDSAAVSQTNSRRTAPQ